MRYDPADPAPGRRRVLHAAGRDPFVVPRADGLLVQARAASDCGNADTAADRALSVAAVERLAEVFA